MSCCNTRLSEHCEIIGYLDIREIKPYQFELLAPILFRLGNYTIKVPKGFKTDFASVPRRLWNTVGPYGYHTKAAVLHDWLYSSSCKENISRDLADELFLIFMTYLKTPKTEKYAMYYGVRNFGKPHFKKVDDGEVYWVEKEALIDKRDERVYYEKYINMLFGLKIY